MVEQFFKDPTESYPLNQTQIQLIKYYIDDRDFGHDTLPWIYHKDGSKELTDWHKQALRLITQLDKITEAERQENAKARSEESEERAKRENAARARQQGFIPRTKAKPRPKFPKQSQLVKKGQAAARKLENQFKGDYSKFKSDVLAAYRKHEKELKRRRAAARKTR